MANTFDAHIFKQRNVGEREEVRVKIFGPDGNPLDLAAGGDDGESVGSTIFIGQFGPPGGDPSALPAGAPFNLPFSGAQIDYIEGLEEPDDPNLYVPAGAYMVTLYPQWEFGEVPASGYASVNLMALYPDPLDEGIEVTSYPLNVHFSDDHTSTGTGTGQMWTYSQQRQAGIASMPMDGRFQLRGETNTDDVTSFSCHVGIAKL